MTLTKQHITIIRFLISMGIAGTLFAVAMRAEDRTEQNASVTLKVAGGVYVVIESDGSIGNLPPGVTVKQVLAALVCWVTNPPQTRKLNPLPKSKDGKQPLVWIETEPVPSKCDEIGKTKETK